MEWYKWLVIIALISCLINCLDHLIRLIRLGKPKDYSHPRGNVASALQYSFTGAMSPLKKESAFLHLPTYMAGLVYHLGTFLAIPMFFLLLTGTGLPKGLNISITVFLMISGACGIGILIKRIITKSLKALSNPDDYISNILVTAFQALTGLSLLLPELMPAFFILTSILLFYIPLGKLKHLLYFFAARYHLGLFFGWRGVWPPKNV